MAVIDFGYEKDTELIASYVLLCHGLSVLVSEQVHMKVSDKETKIQDEAHQLWIICFN